MDTQPTYADVVAFHGHECPGVAVGVHVAELALARVGRHSEENPIVAVSETDTCAVDAIQVLTGCTFGKRNLMHVDNGKNIFTFWRRSTGSGLRVRARPGTDAYRNRQTFELAAKIEQGTATDAERQRFADLQAARIRRILTAAPDDLLLVEDVKDAAPTVRAVKPSLPCQGCGDLTSMASRHNQSGRLLCPPCSGTPSSVVLSSFESARSKSSTERRLGGALD